MKTKIKVLRAERDMTQEELAKQVGVRRETISFLEKGSYNPSLKLAMKIAILFNLPVEDIFQFEPEELM